MAEYNAKMLNAGEDSVPGSYPFEGPDGLLEKSADRIVRTFFEHVDKDIFHHHVDYEVNAAFKNKDGSVNAMGSLHLKDGAHLPFLLMISA